MKSMKEMMELEFSRLVTFEDINGGPVEKHIEAGAEERAALAARLDIAAVDSLAAKVVLRRRMGSPLVEVVGQFAADVTQNCVVTGAPVADHIEDVIDELYGPEDYEPDEDAEGNEAFPELFDAGGIDIGEMVTQLLTLSLNPAPQAAEAEIPRDAVASEASDRRRPFADLGELLKKRS